MVNGSLTTLTPLPPRNPRLVNLNFETHLGTVVQFLALSFSVSHTHTHAYTDAHGLLLKHIEAVDKIKPPKKKTGKR